MASRDVVEALLSMNTQNRSVKRAVVQNYVRDIKSGRWKLTNQGIGVTVDGVLADGQHRLLALRECEYPPVPLLIVTGLDVDVQLVIDAHAKRSARDLLQFAFGQRVTRAAPAIGNIILRARKSWTGGGSTNQELMSVIQEYAEEIEAITAAPKQATYFAAPFMAAFCIYAKEHPHKIAEVQEFMRAVEGGELLTKRMPAFHLRNFITTTRAACGGSSVQKDRFNKAAKALTAAMNGDEMGVLRI